VFTLCFFLTVGVKFFYRIVKLDLGSACPVTTCSKNTFRIKSWCRYAILRLSYLRIRRR